MERDVEKGEGERVPAGETEGTGGRGASVGAPKDSTALLIGDDETAPGAVDSHLIGAKDRFSELGIPLISRCLAFQGLDIDPYLRYALQVDVANVMKELGELLGLESSEAGVSQSASRSQPALPKDVKSFDAEGKVLRSQFFFQVLCVVLSCALVCIGFMKSLGVYGTGSLGRITASLCAKVCAVRR